MPDQRFVSNSIEKYQKGTEWYVKRNGEEHGPMPKEAADQLEAEFRKQR